MIDPALRDRYETDDGSRPQTFGLGQREAEAEPLSAIAVLEGGDVFDAASSSARESARQHAKAHLQAWFGTHFVLEGGTAEVQACVRDHSRRFLGENAPLLRRLLRAKPVRARLIEPGDTLRRTGLPRALRLNAAGLFWDHPSWGEARIVLRTEFFESKPALVAHELGHAVHYLALSERERQLIYRVLSPSFGTRSAMDEVFAIYGEREFLIDTGQEAALTGPGIYGAIRKQWSEDHTFTRFIRKLYYPGKPLAGPRIAGWLGPLNVI
ncbi:MAG: hypothetical protein AAGJ56_01835 [Myxococcota bacterium]